MIDRPLTQLDLDKPGVTRQNLMRLQVCGWPDMKAVRVSVDTSKPSNSYPRRVLTVAPLQGLFAKARDRPDNEIVVIYQRGNIHDNDDARAIRALDLHLGVVYA